MALLVEPLVWILGSAPCAAAVMAVVLPSRRSAARDDARWGRWAAAHGWHHVTAHRSLSRSFFLKPPTPAQRRGVVVRDLSRAVGGHVVRAVEHRRWATITVGTDEDRAEKVVVETTALVEVDDAVVDAPRSCCARVAGGERDGTTNSASTTRSTPAPWPPSSRPTAATGRSPVPCSRRRWTGSPSCRRRRARSSSTAATSCSPGTGRWTP